MSVVETVRFLKDVDRIMPESDREDLVAFVGANPEAGDLIPETGSVRKLRWALPGMGKRGAARIVYYFYKENIPVFLLAAYGKNEKSNLTQAERNTLAKLVPILIREYSRGRGEKL